MREEAASDDDDDEASATSTEVEDEPKWKTHERKMKEAMGWHLLTPSQQRDKQWCARSTLRGLGLWQHRARATIEVCWLRSVFDKLKGNMTLPFSEEDRRMLAADLYVDYSQSMSRLPYGSLRTITTSSRMYSFALDRVIMPQENFFLLGWPRSLQCSFLNDTEARNISGEGQVLPCLATALVALVLNTDLGIWQNNGGKGNGKGGN